MPLHMRRYNYICVNPRANTYIHVDMCTFTCPSTNIRSRLTVYAHMRAYTYIQIEMGRNTHTLHHGNDFLGSFGWAKLGAVKTRNSPYCHQFLYRSSTLLFSGRCSQYLAPSLPLSSFNRNFYTHRVTIRYTQCIHLYIKT